MLLLDCYMPTRFHEKSKWYRKDTLSCMEIIATGQSMQDADGYKTDESDFTNSLTTRLSELCEDGTKRKKLFTIPNHLASDTTLSANPYRVNVKNAKIIDTETKKIKYKVTHRLKIDPKEIRDHKRLVFVRHRVSDDSPDGDDMDSADVAGVGMIEVEDEDEDEDEGFFDDDDDEKVTPTPTPASETRGNTEERMFM